MIDLSNSLDIWVFGLLELLVNALWNIIWFSNHFSPHVNHQDKASISTIDLQFPLVITPSTVTRRVSSKGESFAATPLGICPTCSPLIFNTRMAFLKLICKALLFNLLLLTYRMYYEAPVQVLLLLLHQQALKIVEECLLMAIPYTSLLTTIVLQADGLSRQDTI